MYLLEIWGLIKVVGFSLSLLLGLPLGGRFYVWGVWERGAGGNSLGRLRYMGVSHSGSLWNSYSLGDLHAP